MSKVVFFPDDLHPDSERVKSLLGQNYLCIRSHNVDEFHQAYLQAGKIVLFFSEAQGALKFLRSHSEFLNQIEFKTYLYLSKDGNFSKDSQNILNSHKINVFKKSESDKIIDSISNYFSSREGEAVSIDEIEFLMPGDDDGTAN
jgi:hypothetical protein